MYTVGRPNCKLELSTHWLTKILALFLTTPKSFFNGWQKFLLFSLLALILLYWMTKNLALFLTNQYFSSLIDKFFGSFPYWPILLSSLTKMLALFLSNRYPSTLIDKNFGYFPHCTIFYYTDWQNFWLFSSVIPCSGKVLLLASLRSANNNRSRTLQANIYLDRGL